MRLQISRSKNAASFYVVKSVYVNGKRTNKVHEKLGTYKELKAKLGDKDPYEWAKEYVAELNRLEKEGKEPTVIAKYSPSKLIKKGEQRSFNGGYLFLQKIYHELGLNKICNEISNKYNFEYNLDSILSRLIYGRILFPSSKLSTYELSSELLEPPDFELHQIYRALEVIAKETDFIQSSLYQNSLLLSKRNSGILYYDCTNYFFEIEEGEGLKQYGLSKDHKSNPIVQMGLFMDGDGIPLAFSVTEGNKNEQLTLKPLEKKILSDFKLSKIDTNPSKINKSNQNDYKRFIKKTHCTDDGEYAENEIYSIDTELINKEEAFDGFYAVCTNLDEAATEIIKINRRRWEIEECFQILKSEFKARPVYLKRDDRITAHFTACFIALIIFRILEKRLNEQFTCETIIHSLRKMNFKLLKGEGYEPIYTRTDFTDALHESFGFRTDYEIVTLKQMKKIFKITKNK